MLRSAVSPPALQELKKKPRLAIFVSGGGSNFRAIHAAIFDGRIDAEVAVRPTLESHRFCLQTV